MLGLLLQQSTCVIGEALQPSFEEYGRQVIENARVMAEAFVERGYADVEEVTTTVETITFALPRDLRLPRRENPAVAGG